jgi:two-component system sensor histidine kinase MprB
MLRDVVSKRRALTLRGRLTLITAVAVAVAIALASGAAWFATRATLRQQVDQTMQSGPQGLAAGRVVDSPPGDAIRGAMQERACEQQSRVPALQRFLVRTQLVRADGTTCTPAGVDPVQPTVEDIAVASGGSAQALHDATSQEGTHVRVLTRPFGEGYALMTSRSLEEVDSSLNQLALVLVVVTALGVLGAATAGLVVSRAGLAPVDHLTRAAEHIARTQDLGVPIAVRGDDEVARLAQAFNAMTSALARSRARQQELVADASHELRTPLTSLRTNIEWLMRSEEADRPLPPDRRRRLLASVTAQMEELADLIGELTVLTRDERGQPHVPMAFDEVVLRAAERAQLRAGARRIDLRLEPCKVWGNPSAVERAVLNLLDNAVKFSPPDSTVSVALCNGRLTITDEGAGIPEHERTLVFERFWRSPTARELPGSGLGLAIVADTVASHYGRVAVERALGGGTAMIVELPVLDRVSPQPESLEQR